MEILFPMSYNICNYSNILNEVDGLGSGTFIPSGLFSASTEKLLNDKLGAAAAVVAETVLPVPSCVEVWVLCVDVCM